MYRPDGSSYEPHCQAGDCTTEAEDISRRNHSIVRRMGIDPQACRASDRGAGKSAQDTADDCMSDVLDDVNAFSRVIANPGRASIDSVSTDTDSVYAGSRKNDRSRISAGEGARHLLAGHACRKENRACRE